MLPACLPARLERRIHYQLLIYLFLVGEEVGTESSVMSGRAFLLYLILTVLLAIIITAFCWRICQTDVMTTYRQAVTRLKYYYYYYLRRAPAGNKFF